MIIKDFMFEIFMVVVIEVGVVIMIVFCVGLEVCIKCD